MSCFMVTVLPWTFIHVIVVTVLPWTFIHVIVSTVLPWTFIHVLVFTLNLYSRFVVTVLPWNLSHILLVTMWLWTFSEFIPKLSMSHILKIYISLPPEVAISITHFWKDIYIPPSKFWLSNLTWEILQFIWEQRPWLFRIFSKPTFQYFYAITYPELALLAITTDLDIPWSSHLVRVHTSYAATTIVSGTEE